MCMYKLGNAMTITQKDIENGLLALGFEQGDVVLVHSSLSSFGQVEGGAEAVVDALLAVLGEKGTLVVPTFNFNPGIFDPKATPSVVGKITETVRNRPDAIRSLHPTHSVAAVGPMAEAITEGHDKMPPFGRGSALFKVLQAKGKVLQLGTTHTSNSMIHVAEEIAGVVYLDRQRQVSVTNARGKTVDKWVRRPGCSRGFDAIDEELESREAIREARIGDCLARLMSARAVVDAAVAMLKFDQEALLCDLPDCESCAEARAMISATETEKQDQEVIELADEEERTRHFVEKRLEGNEVKFFVSDEHHFSPN